MSVAAGAVLSFVRLRSSRVAAGHVRAGRSYLNRVIVHARVVDPAVGDTLTLRVRDERGDLVREITRGTRLRAEIAPLTFPFEAIPDSDARRFDLEILTDAPASSLELEVDETGALCAEPGFAADLARVFDPWLSRCGQVLPAVPERLERYLDLHVAECVKMKRFFFLRLAHLAEAFGRVPERIDTMLSIGAGMGYQEAFLAGRFPDLQVLATDYELTNGPFPMQNLRFEQLDLLEPPGPEQYDFVVSIECLEHIEDYRRAFRHQAARVKPGKYLYISVPFATREEQRDPDLRKTAWDLCEHYTPGFAFEDLEELFAENGLEVLHAANMFFVDLILPIRRIVDQLDAGELDAGAEALTELLLLDLRDRRVDSFRRAEGIRFLGRKRSV